MSSLSASLSYQSLLASLAKKTLPLLFFQEAGQVGLFLPINLLCNPEQDCLLSEPGLMFVKMEALAELVFLVVWASSIRPHGLSRWTH